MWRIVVVALLIACSGKRSLPPLPELDASAWAHVQELAKPAGPNGPTKDLEAAIAIAWKQHWISAVGEGARVSKEKLADFDAVMALLRTWRDQRGGTLLIDVDNSTSDPPGTTAVWPALLASDDTEATEIVLVMGQRTLEQADSLLNFSIGLAMVTGAVERAKKRGSPISVDVSGLERGIVRAVAGEVVWMRKERERIAAVSEPTDFERESAADLDAAVPVMIDVLRGLRPESTVAQLLERLRTADRSVEATKRHLDMFAEMLRTWRDKAAGVFVP